LRNFSWAYGTIGTFIVLLLWLDLSSLVMLIGAQLNVTVGKAIKQSKIRGNW
jgi:membrane protein